MASVEQIETFIRRSHEFVHTHLFEIIRQLNDQRQREFEIIQRTESFCPLNQIKDKTIRSEEITKALKEGYGDASVLKVLMCLNNSILMLPRSAGFVRNIKTREYLQSLEQIGGESAEGYAMVAKDNLFVVKAPRQLNEQLRANQIHEYFVGAFGTNALRSKIPNFSYIMGFFQCSPPYVDSRIYLTNERATKENIKDRRALTYCQNDLSGNQVNYLLYENVTNAKTLHQYIIDGCSYEQFLNILTQLSLALDYAYIEKDFTHYDLHDENVLIKELNEEIYIPYPGTDRYLKTKYVATIIDLGRSHIKYEGNDYGYANIEYGIYPDRSYPMYDIYKILMFSLATAAFGNSAIQSYIGLTDDEIDRQKRLANEDVFQNAKELLSYFVPDIARNQVTRHIIAASDYLIKTRKFYYALPFKEEFNIRPLRFYEDALLKVSPNIITQFMLPTPIGTDKNKIYGCANKGTCMSLEQALTNYSEPEFNFIDDPYVFYEMLHENEYSEKLIAAGESRFEQYINRLKLDRDRYVNEYNQLAQGFNIVSLAHGAPDKVKFRDEFLDAYRKFIAKSVKMVDLLTSIYRIETIMITLNKLFPEKTFHLDTPKVNMEVSYLNEVIESIKEDVSYVKSLDENEILRINFGAIWLFEKLPTLTAAITKF